MEALSSDPWPVIRGILLELSSYDVPKVVDRAGLRVDWALTKAQDYSDKMRIAAYRPKIDAAYDRLSSEGQFRAVSVLAEEIASRGHGEELDRALEAIGWHLEGGRLEPETAAIREQFFPKQSQHDAYVRIRGILQAAATSVFLVDPYVDQSVLELLTSALKPGMAIRILTERLPPDFTQEARSWRAQHADASLEVRTTHAFHDRFIIVDGEACWHLGCSVKDAGGKAFMLSKVEDAGNRSALVAQIEESWLAATQR